MEASVRRWVGRVALAVALGAVLPTPTAVALAGADLSVTLVAGRDSVAVPGRVALTVTVSNAGPEAASGTLATLDIPPGLSTTRVPAGCDEGAAMTCSVGSLAAGASTQLRIEADVVRAGTHTVASTVEHPGEDPQPANDRAVAVLTGAGRSCDLVGTPDDDDLVARERGVVACGLDGDDVLVGGRGRDRLFGGEGRDVLGGGPGRDRLDGGGGRDGCAQEAGSGPSAGCEVSSFASATRLPLFRVGATVGYGYHQSLFGTAIGLSPWAPHVVMASRGRGTGPTTAVDVVMPSHARVRAPVTGTVLRVTRYLLYCRYRDWKVVVAPRGLPDLRVLVLHLGRTSVREGEQVTAGVSLLGRAAGNDLATSQANTYFPDRYPHVHVEVERHRAAPTPGCSI